MYHGHGGWLWGDVGMCRTFVGELFKLFERWCVAQVTLVCVDCLRVGVRMQALVRSVNLGGALRNLAALFQVGALPFQRHCLQGMFS
jgi:hypothetical protein